MFLKHNCYSKFNLALHNVKTQRRKKSQKAGPLL